MADSTPLYRWDDIRQPALTALPFGHACQLPNGRAAAQSDTLSAGIGDLARQLGSGQRIFTKNVGMILDGGNVFWDPVNHWATYFRANSSCFFLGTACGDALSAATTMTVNINVAQWPTNELKRDPFASAIVLTSGKPAVNWRGGAADLVLDATNEAQKVDALSRDGFATTGMGIVEACFTVIGDDSGTAAIFSVGIASGTDATAFTSIADYLGVQVKAHDTHVYAASKATGGVTVAPTDTTTTYTVGTRCEVWFDLRNPAAVAVYVNAVRVLTSTVFDVSFYTAATWYLLAHLAKTSSTDTMEVSVDRLISRTSSQN